MFLGGFWNLLWHVQFEQHDDIATAATSLAWKASFSHLNGFALVAVRWDLDDQGFIVEMVKFNRRSQQQIGIPEGQGHDQIRT